MVTAHNSKDLDLNVVKKELENKLYVKTDGSKWYIAVTNDTKRDGSKLEEISTNVSLGGKVNVMEIINVEANLGVSHATKNEDHWKNSDLSDQKQLEELNAASKEHIQWEIEGEKVIPKTTFVSKLSKATIFKDFVMQMTVQRVTNSQYTKTFQVEQEALPKPKPKETATLYVGDGLGQIHILKGEYLDH